MRRLGVGFRCGQWSCLAAAVRYGGSFRVPPDWELPESCCAWLRCRGSGPGGQAVNKSMNKAELQLDLGKLLCEAADVVDYATVETLRSKFHAQVSKNDCLIVRSHAHRSALQNEAECRKKVRQMVHESSWEEDAPVDIATLGTPKKDQHKYIIKKRIASNFRKARASAKMSAKNDGW